MRYAKSQYSESRYFTPEPLSPLRLDVASLDGGGRAPSQFYGKTHDGREIYCRYRGGQLTVHVAKSPETSSLAEGTCILKAQIGPPLDGELTLSQLCRHAGITINRAPPAPDEPEAHGGSFARIGSMTHYSVWVPSTFVKQKRFLACVLREFRDVSLLQPDWKPGPRKYESLITGYSLCPSVDGLTSNLFWLIFGPSLKSRLQGIKPWSFMEKVFPEHLVATAAAHGFQHNMIKYGNTDAGQIKKLFGVDIEVAGQVDDCLHNSLHFRTQFRVTDTERKDRVAAFDELLDQFYPKCHVRHFDLATGDQDPDEEYFIHHDLEVVKWVGERENRYLHVLYQNPGDPEKRRFLGAKIALSQ